jgi:hypothetical protein
MREEVIVAIPQGSPDQVLEVVLVHDPPAAARLELRSCSWGRGVGWYRQQTLRLDPRAVHALHRTLSQLRRRLGAGGQPAPGGKVLPLLPA